MSDPSPIGVRHFGVHHARAFVSSIGYPASVDRASSEQPVGLVERARDTPRAAVPLRGTRSLLPPDRSLRAACHRHIATPQVLRRNGSP